MAISFAIAPVLFEFTKIFQKYTYQQSSGYSRFLVEAGESLRACAVYPQITISGNTATLKDVRHIEPNVRCIMVAFDENLRSYNIALDSENGCSKVYKGKNEKGSLLINDYRVDDVVDNSKPKPFVAFIVSASEALSQEA